MISLLPSATAIEATSWLAAWKGVAVIAVVAFGLMCVWVGWFAIGDLFAMFRDLSASRDDPADDSNRASDGRD